VSQASAEAIAAETAVAEQAGAATAGKYQVDERLHFSEVFSVFRPGWQKR
jgi:hypothetical protein